MICGIDTCQLVLLTFSMKKTRDDGVRQKLTDGLSAWATKAVRLTKKMIDFLTDCGADEPSNLICHDKWNQNTSFIIQTISEANGDDTRDSRKKWDPASSLDCWDESWKLSIYSEFPHRMGQHHNVVSIDYFFHFPSLPPIILSICSPFNLWFVVFHIDSA